MTFGEHEARRCRRDFPALARAHHGHPIAYFDGPGGTQVPTRVIDAISEAYVERNANFDGAFSTSERVTAAVADARAAVSDFLGAPGAACISFGANMTTLNFALAHALGRAMAPGDEVVITALDHEANRGPWLMLEQYGVVVREVPFGTDGELNLDALESTVGAGTRLVAVTLASNALGTVPDVARIREVCERHGAWLLVDAVHYAAHFPVDVTSLDIDFLLCSAYKFYGPHVGILYAREGLLDTLDPDHLRTQKQAAPYRIETGTLNHAAIAGVTAAIDYLADWGDGHDRRTRITAAMQAIHDYETGLASDYATRLRSLGGARVWGPSFGDAPRAPTVSISIDGHAPDAIAASLAERGIQVWHGHFYAIRVLETLGLDRRGGLVRVGISMYNTRDEIDRLVDGLEAIVGA